MKLNESLNHTQLIKAVADEADVSLFDAADVLRALFDVVGRTVANGGSVTVTNFGTWFAKESPARQVRNPQTREIWEQAARNYPRFRYSPAVKEATISGDVPATFQKRASR